ncbi:MAG: hypothetical protein L6Q97_07995 [Thermoanaerobaculia bacterium]|nr:hypothetical protein [Thermoanaerobaculia bacterium]
MFRQKIQPGDVVRQKSTGAVLQADFTKHDVWICHSLQTGRQHIVSINDVEKIKPQKPPGQTP